MAAAFQFSIRTLLLQTALIGASLGSFGASLRLQPSPETRAWLFLGGCVAAGAAVGGLFGKPMRGVFCVLTAFLVLLFIAQFLQTARE